MPWVPPEKYEPMPSLLPHLKAISPKMNTPEMDMVLYVQWVHECVRPFCRTPAEGYRATRQPTPRAQQAIDKRLVLPEIYPLVLKRALQPALGPAKSGVPPIDGYEPRPDLEPYLRSISPKMNTSEMDMVIYWQWVHASVPPFQKTPAEAWRDLRMKPALARDAIAKRIVPMEIYPDAYERAFGKAKKSPAKAKVAPKKKSPKAKSRP